jgi:hypothetical protein
MIPAGDSKHQIRIGDLYRIHNDAFALESISTISTSFGYGSLVYFADIGQYNVILTVYSRISIVAVGVLAGVYLFENVSVIEIIYFGCRGG